MDTIAFALSKELLGRVDICIDERDLIEMVREFETTFSPVLAGSYMRLHKNAVLWPSQHLFGRPLENGDEARIVKDVTSVKEYVDYTDYVVEQDEPQVEDESEDLWYDRWADVEDGKKGYYSRDNPRRKSASQELPELTEQILELPQEEISTRGRDAGFADVLSCGGCGFCCCWLLRVKITLSESEVVWSNFYQPHRQGQRGTGRLWDYDGFGPFRFDREQYETALKSVR